MNTIRNHTTLVRRVSQGEIRDEYTVGDRAHLTLVYVVSGRSRIELFSSVHLAGEGSRVTVIGLVNGFGSGRIHIATLQHHAAEHTTSSLLIKSVLRDESVCMYEGSIIVDKSAQKTDAYQRNENLLMDTDTKAISSPILEILANDVRCTHGAVVKTLDPEELWYLESRGITRVAARSMIAQGFLESAMSLITDTGERADVEGQVRMRERRAYG